MRYDPESGNLAKSEKILWITQIGLEAPINAEKPILSGSVIWLDKVSFQLRGNNPYCRYQLLFIPAEILIFKVKSTSYLRK